MSGAKCNYHVILQERPGVSSEPKEEHFAHVACAYPEPCGEDTADIIVQTLYLSVDPALRCRMNESSGVDYVESWSVNSRLDGFGGVGRVVEAGAGAGVAVGDIVCSSFYWPWALYAKMDTGKHPVRKVDADVCGGDVSVMLSVLGGVGVTTLLAIKNKAHIEPGTGQCMVVSGAAGACGTLAGQIAKLYGCDRVVGVCSSRAKCEVITTDMGYDAAIAYKEEDVAERLRHVAPSGVNMYFDNVGGSISDTVLEQMCHGGHVILCGQISQYNKDVPYPPPLSSHTQALIEERNITRDRFLVFDYQHEFEDAVKELGQLLHGGKIKPKHTVMSGLHNAGNAFVFMMRGGNIGKQLIHVSD